MSCIFRLPRRSLGAQLERPSRTACAGSASSRVVGLLVLATVAFGLWVAVIDIRENVRLAKLSDQILGTVSFARDMGIATTTDADRATQALIQSVTQMRQLEPIVKDKKMIGMPNAWDAPAYVRVFPASQQLGIETQIPYTACRRFLKLYAKQVAPLGIMVISARDVSAGVGVRQIRGVDGSTPLSDAEIKSGCGNAEAVALGLVFRLQKQPTMPPAPKN